MLPYPTRGGWSSELSARFIIVSLLCTPFPCASHLLGRGQPLHVVGEVLLHLDLAARLLEVAPRLRLLPLLRKLSSDEKEERRREEGGTK